MKPFNYDSYMKNNPLLKETDGYGNYKIPVLEDKEDFEYTDEDEHGYMDNDELDAAEKSGKLSPSGAKLGPDGEIMEEDLGLERHIVGNEVAQDFRDSIAKMKKAKFKSIEIKNLFDQMLNDLF